MDLEQELWRLRSVEYDLEQARKQIAELEATQEANAQETSKAVAQEAVMRGILEEEKKTHINAAKERNAYMEECAKLRKQIERLEVALEKYQNHEYMQTTYGFEVVDKPLAARANRKGWRLNR